MFRTLENFTTIKNELKAYVSLFLFVTIILFFISHDSYTHNLWQHCDSSAFFVCGKSWMNGMIPYVDFADSKGPLLWFIMGIGYLISPSDYVGVFWLTCFFFSITFFICYKIGALLTGNRRLGYVVSLLMALPYFFLYWHELKSEMLCHPFIAASLYCLLREILYPSARFNRTAGTILGVTFMATLLIKWSIAVMSLSFVVSYLGLLLYRKVSCTRFFVNFCLAAIVLLFPFLIYMVSTNSFHAFLHEYFINTGASVGEGGMSSFLYSYIQDIVRLFTARHGMLIPGLFSIMYLVGVYLFYRYQRNITLLPFFCCSIFLAISVKHNIWSYYTIILQTFAIFLVVLLVKSCFKKYSQKKKIGRFGIISVYVVMMLIVIGLRGYSFYRNDAFFFQNKERKEYYDTAWLMGQIKNPTIMYFGRTDTGVGLPVNALPACTYWTDQVGATDEMNKLRWQSVGKKEPDFIAVSTSLKGEEKSRILAAGYQYYLTVEKLAIYGRKRLKMPPSNFTVSNLDILLKRKIKFNYKN